MTDETTIKFAQFLIDRFYGHQLTEQIIRNALRDYRRESK